MRNLRSQSARASNSRLGASESDGQTRSDLPEEHGVMAEQAHRRSAMADTVTRSVSLRIAKDDQVMASLRTKSSLGPAESAKCRIVVNTGSGRRRRSTGV